MRLLVIFLLLVCILLCSLYLFKEQNVKIDFVPNVNLQLSQRYNNYVKNIHKHRIGQPREFYNNPNAPYSNPYPLHPKPFIDGYRQPIDGIVYGDYTSPTLKKSNLMYPELIETVYDYVNGVPVMDMRNDGYYNDFLNENTNIQNC
jgi:hypothetical protein